MDDAHTQDTGPGPDEAIPTEEGLEGDGAVAEDGPRVIEIGWQIVLLPVLAIVMVAGGWFLGRQLAMRGQAEDPVAAAPQAEAPGFAAGQTNAQGQVQAPAQGGSVPVIVTVAAPSGSQSGGIDQTRVYELPERFHPLIGQPAPDFTMRYLGTEEEVSLSSFAGQPVVLNFWATWCPPCRAEMPWIESVYNKYKDQGLVVLAIDAGEKVPPSMVEETVQRYIDSTGLTFPVLLGDNTYDVQRQYSVMGLPGTVMVGADGIVRAFHSGMFPNEATFEDQVKRHLLTDAAPIDEAPAEGGDAGADG